VHCVTIRRRRGSTSRPTVDFALQAEDTSQLASQIRALLCVAEVDRGRGQWSPEDPEVWLGRTLIGSLEARCGNPELVQALIDELSFLKSSARPETQRRRRA
jgi:hypothetical protein